MYVWRAKWTDPDTGFCQSWATTKDDAEESLKQAIASLKENDPDDDGQPCSIERVQIPTHQEGLVHWLNQNFSTDNG